MTSFDEIHFGKDVTVSDVHVATAMGNSGKGKKRRREISIGPTASLTGPTDVTSLAGVDLNKRERLSKEEAGYVDQAPGSEMCRDCTMFREAGPPRRPEDRCTLVKGSISPEGHCKYFEAKGAVGKQDLPEIAIGEVSGIPISIETAAGQKRASEATPLLAHYGRVPGTKGADGDELDVFVGEELDSDRAWVINEANPDGRFRQVKIMLGFAKKKAARKAYLSGQFPGRQIMGIVETTYPKLKIWIRSGDTDGPFPETLAKRAPLVGVDGRQLEPFARGLAKNPLPTLRHALSHIRPDQVPRLFEALTHPDRLDKRKVRIGDLSAIQDRVDPNKVAAMMAGEHKMDKRPVVVRFAGRKFVVDGDHHIAARWLLGKDRVKTRYLDLTPRTEAMKRFDLLTGVQPVEKHADGSWSAPIKVTKADPDKQLIFGWASVSTVDGELIIDKQGDCVPPSELEDAAYDYVLHARDMGHMHEEKGVGSLIESMVFTEEKQKLLGIDLGMVAWWTGHRVSHPGVWAAIKRGELPELSIGGFAVPVEM